MKTSPTQRTLAFLRAAGHTVAITEKWNQFSKTRQDLFGFLDLVALHPGDKGVLGVQTTSGTNHAARLTKLLAIPAAKLWVETGNRLWVMSWSKCGARGKRKLWTPRIEKVEIGQFSEGIRHVSEDADTAWNKEVAEYYGAKP